ncbi:MAG: uracil-DNA glycosylase [Inquilinus sp.]|nr:uracil-DNA glycosylase [Inquilinus sp.]
MEPQAPRQPDLDCPLCPRLAAFRAANRTAFPDFHNAPVASFGPTDAPLLVVGLAPGLRGANRTGRPFTGDFAGDLLYGTLTKYGLATGVFDARPDDGLTLTRCRITNAVRCVPPENKPVAAEVTACRGFLAGELAAMVALEGVVALGGIAHKAVLAALGLKQSVLPFAHGAIHALPDGRFLADSYHCSRYNTNTGRLTPAMFEAVFAEVSRRIATT